MNPSTRPGASAGQPTVEDILITAAIGTILDTRPEATSAEIRSALELGFPKLAAKWKRQGTERDQVIARIISHRPAAAMVAY